jgi:esterase/lipase superfamily enzyme
VEVEMPPRLVPALIAALVLSVPVLHGRQVPPSAMLLDGTVTNALGYTVSGAAVVVTDSTGFVISKGTTDKHGNYRLVLPPGSATYTITATYRGDRDQATRYFPEPKSPADDRHDRLREFVVNLALGGGKRITGVNEFPVFYVTNRQRQSPQGTYFNAASAPDGQLSHGLAAMRVPRRHHAVRLETPAMRPIDTSETFVHRAEVGLLSAAEFLAQVSNPRLPADSRVLIFVHGFDVTFEEALAQVAQLVADIGFTGRAVVYSWPSGHINLTNPLPGMVYTRARKELEDGRPEAGLKWLLEEFAKTRGLGTQFVLAHSMGADVAMRAIRHASVNIHELMFAAPDIAQHSFGIDYPDLAKRSERFTLYFNPRDRALRASEKANLGFTRQGTDCGSPKTSKPPDCIDASALRTDFWRHSYHLDTESIVTDILQITCNRAPIDRRGLLAIRKPDWWLARQVATAIPKECFHKVPLP